MGVTGPLRYEWIDGPGRLGPRGYPYYVDFPIESLFRGVGLDSLHFCEYKRKIYVCTAFDICGNNFKLFN